MQSAKTEYLEIGKNMRKYQIELEIYQGKGGCLCHDGTYPDFATEGICAWMFANYQVGQIFHYPEDLGKLCPWLLDSLSGVIRALENGGTLPWKYKGTPYEKVINPNGVTTEYVRCLDPTASGIVIKVTRTALPE